MRGPRREWPRERLATVPGVGPVTAARFVATLDSFTRFGRAHAVEAYLGLVPSERSSGERQHRGRLTKSGNTRPRSLLVESVWLILRWKHAQTAPLWQWAEVPRGTRTTVP